MINADTLRMYLVQELADLGEKDVRIAVLVALDKAIERYNRMLPKKQSD